MDLYSNLSFEFISIIIQMTNLRENHTFFLITVVILNALCLMYIKPCKVIEIFNTIVLYNI